MVIYSALAIHNADTVIEFRIISLDIHRNLLVLEMQKYLHCKRIFANRC